MAITESITPEIEIKIKELKKRFVNKMDQAMNNDKYLFYRFLKARDFNVDQTESMMQKHLDWRKEFNVEAIKAEPYKLDAIEEYLTQCYIGFDKEGSPIKYFAYGSNDFKGWRLSTKWSDRIKTTIKFSENEMARVESQIKKTGNYFLGTTYIIDMKDFSFFTATDKQFITESLYLSKLYQENYPERLQRIIIINASPYFTILFSIIKTVLSASLMDKINIFSSPETWKPELLKYIDADVLPKFLGGKKTDPDGDPLCKSFVKHGSKIPTEMYIHSSKSTLIKSKDSKKLALPRAAFSEIEVEVEEAGSLIEWEFEIKCRDIGFGLFLKELQPDGEENMTALVPLIRLDTEEVPETGVYKCDKPGTYIMLFDNSYSWVRSKEIYYKATVVKPKDQEKNLAK